MKIRFTDLFGTAAPACVRSSPGMRRSSLARSSIGGMGLVMILSGCAFVGSNGQSKESAEAGLLSVPGVSDAKVNTESTQSGFQVETSTVIEISLEPGYSAPDPAALADFLLTVAWSTKTKEANWAVRLDVVSDPQISMLDAMDADGWQTKSGIVTAPERASVRADEVRDRFGDWPGDVPEVPDGLIVGPTPEPTP